MNAVTFPTVDLCFDGARATIAFNRPEKRNAMSPQVHADMHSALDEVERRGDVRLIVIVGRGDNFCAGMDLEEFLLGNFGDSDMFMRTMDLALSWMKRLRNFNGITISAVQGWCVGGGILVAGLCDLSVAASNARFSLSEINFAVIPGAGLTWMVARHLPRKVALYYLLTGQVFDGHKAAEIGLVNHVVPVADLSGEIDRLSTELAAKDRHAAVAIKRVFERSVEMDFDEAVEWESAKFFELSYTSRQKWLDVALQGFSNRKFKPALENYTTIGNRNIE